MIFEKEPSSWIDDEEAFNFYNRGQLAATCTLPKLEISGEIFNSLANLDFEHLRKEEVRNGLSLSLE